MHCFVLRPCVGFNHALICLWYIAESSCVTLLVYSELSCLQVSTLVGSFFVMLCFKTKERIIESLASCRNNKCLLTSYVKSWIFQPTEPPLLGDIRAQQLILNSYCCSAFRPRRSCGSSRPPLVSESLKLPGEQTNLTSSMEEAALAVWHSGNISRPGATYLS